MIEKLYKARLMRENGEDMDLAWNIHDIEYDKYQAVYVIHHAKGRVMHRLKEGDTIVCIEQRDREVDKE